jgi:quercetin dioxygenase-like cupin family protein
MRWTWLILAVPLAALAPTAVQAQAQAQAGAEGKGLVAKAHLPKLNGATLEGSVIEVKYGPGGKSAAHRHPCPVFAYVAEGAVRSALGDGPMEVFSAGQGWYEAPLTRHRSENASTTAPARLVAFFVCDSPKPLVIPDTGRAASQ